MVEVTVTHLAPLVEAVQSVDAGWLSALGGGFPSAVVDDDVEAMTDAGLLAVNEALAGLGRRVQALQARIAHGISRRSARELGSDGLARKAGFRSAEKLIAATTGGHVGDAKKLVQVGDATAGRMTFSGERAPARHPHVAAAIEAGVLSVACAGAITTLLDRVACRADRALLAQAEQTLVEQAAGLSLSELQVVLRRAEAWLDPDGLEPKIENLRDARFLRIWEDQHGMINLDGRLDPATGAPIKAAIDALVTAQIRAMRGHNHPDGDGTDGDGGWTWSDGGKTATDTDDSPAADGANADDSPDTGAGHAGATGPGASDTGAGDAGAAGVGGPVERRTIMQLQADALSTLAKIGLGSENAPAPLATTTVVVRIPLEALTTGTGVATIDGLTQPIDAGTARRMAADAEIIPIVLGSKSEVLDYGRSRRLFSKAQRLALVERDGGCANCAAPPGMCEVHHLTWWSHGGRTDLDDGILLCTSCHHMVHTEGWDIRIDDTGVWFIPPAHIDPTRTPRPGGRRRHDYQPAA
ncbi:HNH endonuclease [Microbacterium mangrovi]|nr:HNH endonuclease signature motif containing protein [Microbacterium mangrovi]